MYILYTTTIKGFRFISAEILGSVKNQGKLRKFANMGSLGPPRQGATR
jgi:hypothetical protein